MNTVSAAFLAQLRAAAGDFCVVCEFYEHDAVPGASGFDPLMGGFMQGYAQVDGLVFRGMEYERQVKTVGGLKRSVGKEFNSCSVTFSNLDLALADFHLTYGIEGLLMVVRLLSRSVSCPRSRHWIEWDGLLHATITAGNRFTASHGDDLWNPGASSSVVLEAGEEGYDELTVGLNDPERMFGLGTTNTGGGYARINFAAFLFAGSLIVFESGVNKGPVGTYVQGDILQVYRDGSGVVTYRKNGAILYTSLTTETGALYANGAVKLNNTSLENLTLSGFGAEETLADSMVLFVGRCEKAVEASKTDFRVTAKHILGSIDVELPRRKFDYNDADGRAPSDVLFEGFRYMPQTGNIQYQARERKGGLGALLGLKKTVTRSLAYSSHSALDAEKPVPLLLGRAQISGTHVSYIDYGNSIAMVTAFTDGGDYGILGFVNFRSVSAQYTPIIQTIYSPQYRFGLAGNTGVGDRAQVKLHYAGEPTATDPWPGDGYYSRTSFTGSFVNGSAIESDDPAPDLAAVVFGLVLDMPDGSGDYTETGYSDNPIHQTRFILHSPTHMNLEDGWFDDSVHAEEAAYCDAILVDNASSDAAFLPDSEDGRAGTDYKLYKSSGVITPEWFMYQNGEDVNPWSFEADYEFYDAADETQIPIEPIDPPDPPGPGQVLATGYRRRYTSNVLLTETMPAADFIYDVLFPAFRGYLTQAATGQLRIKVKRPADSSLIRTAITAPSSVVPVYNVQPWRSSVRGKLLIGAHLSTSEVRTVTGARYTTAGNSITFTASGGVSASAATLTGGDNADAAASGILTVTATAAEKVVTIDGFVLRYTAAVTDTVETIAGMIAAQINSHPVLSKYILAVWDTGLATVTVYATLGFLDLGAALANNHAGPKANPTVAPTAAPASGGSLAAGDYQLTYSWVHSAGGETLCSPVDTETVALNQKIDVTAITPLPTGIVSANWYVSIAPNSTRRRLVNNNNGAAFSILSVPAMTAQMEPGFNSASEECIRVEMAFSDRSLAASDHTAADIIRGSAKWPLGGNQSSVNQIELSYHDAVQDWRRTTLTVRDDAHQAKVHKKLPLKLNGSAIDSYHQAARIANGALAELRDADFFHAWSADREAILLEEGDVVCLSEESGGFINSPCRIESLSVDVENGFPKVTFTARAYSSALYDDRVTEKNIPLPSTLIGLIRRPAADVDWPTPVILWIEEGIDIGAPGSAVVYTAPVGYKAYITAVGMEANDVVIHNTFSLMATVAPSEIFTAYNFAAFANKFCHLPLGPDPADGSNMILTPGQTLTLSWPDSDVALVDFYVFGFLKPYAQDEQFDAILDTDGFAITDTDGLPIYGD